MRKFLKILIMCLLIVGAISLIQSMTAVRHSSELEGKPATVTWTELNLRNGAGRNEEILTTLEKGDVVSLTGNCRDATVGGETADFWCEVRWTDSQEVEITGWVYSCGITHR